PHEAGTARERVDRFTRCNPPLREELIQERVEARAESARQPVVCDRRSAEHARDLRGERSRLLEQRVGHAANHCASRPLTSSSLVGRKSSYQSPTARNERGVAAQTTSSA